MESIKMYKETDTPINIMDNKWYFINWVEGK